MTHIHLMECVGGESGCPTPTEHRVRVEDWERGPEAGEARFEALHFVLMARREIRLLPDHIAVDQVLWTLVNVGRVAGQQWYTEEVVDCLRDCATLLCKALQRKLVAIAGEKYIDGWNVGRYVERNLNG